MKTIAALIVSLATLTPSLPAFAAPAYCGDYTGKDVSMGNADFALKQLQHDWEGWPGKEWTDRGESDLILKTLRYGCKFADHAELQKFATERRAAWMEKHLMLQEDGADLQALLPASNTPDPKTEIAKRKLSALAPLDVLRAFDVVAGRSSGDMMTYAYLLDGYVTPPELLKLKYVQACIDRVQPGPAGWALCAADEASLDRKKLSAELAGPEVSARTRLKLKLLYSEVKEKSTAMRVQMDKKGAEDPTYVELIKTIPEKAIADWNTQYEKNRAAIDEAHAAYDDTFLKSRRALAAHAPVLVEKLQAMVKSEHVDTEQKLKDLLDIPAAAIVAAGLETSFDGDKAERPEFDYFGNQVYAHPAARGPRFAAYRALVAAAPKLKFDDGTKIPVSSLPELRFRDGHPNGSNVEVKGSISGVAESDDVVTVSFKSVSFSENVCDAHQETGVIDRIENGKFIYRVVCTKEHKQKITVQPEPVKVPKALAGGLKAGRFGLFAVKSAGRAALPVWVKANPDAPTLLSVFGAEP